MGPQCNHRCPYKRKAGGRFEKQEEDNVATEAAIVLWPQANEHGGYWKLEEARRDSPPRACRESRPLISAQ